MLSTHLHVMLGAFFPRPGGLSYCSPTTLLCFLSCIHLSTNKASTYTAVALEICFPTASHPRNPGQQAPAKALGSYYTTQAGGKQGTAVVQESGVGWG